jgi:hypothetical protein
MLWARLVFLLLLPLGLGGCWEYSTRLGPPPTASSQQYGFSSPTEMNSPHRVSSKLSALREARIRESAVRCRSVQVGNVPALFGCEGKRGLFQGLWPLTSNPSRSRVAYPGAVENVSRRLPSPLSDVHQLVIRSRNPCVGLHPAHLTYLCAHLSRATPQL